MKLPKEFNPFEEINFCSNIMRNCDIPIVVAQRPIVLVGKGAQPQIWIWGLADKDSKDLVQIVSCNSVSISMEPIKVESENNYTRVTLNDTIIIEAHKHSEEKAMVNQLDMRPLGFDIYGDSSVLNVGTNLIGGNQISGGSALIAID